MICSLGDVIVVPFPFVDSSAAKRRPSVVLSAKAFNESNSHSICAMITTASRTNWPNDISITDLDTAGLQRSCVVRFKLFTLPNAIILKRIGALGDEDRSKIVAATHAIMS